MRIIQGLSDRFSRPAFDFDKLGRQLNERADRPGL